MDETINTTVLRLEIDRQAAANVNKALGVMQDGVKDLNQELANLGPQSQRAQQLAARFTSLGKEVNQDLAFVRQFSRELGLLDGKKVNAEVNVKTNESGPRELGELGRLGMGIKNLPSIQLGNGLSSDAIGKIMTVLDVGLSSVGPAGIAAAAASAAAGLAFSVFAEDLEKYTKRIEERAKAFFSSLDESSKLLAEGATSDRVDQVRQEALTEQARIQANIDQLKSLQAGYEALQDPTQGATGVFGVRAIGRVISGQVAGREFLEANTPDASITSIETLNTQLELLESQLEGADIRVAQLNGTLSSFEIAANDAAEAAKKADAELVDRTMNRFRAEAEAAKFAETATLESTARRIAAAENEKQRLFQINQELEQIGGEAAEAQIAVNNQRIVEQQLIVETTQAIIGSVQARVAEEDAVKRVADAIKAASAIGRQITSQTATVESAADKVVSAEQALADARTNAAAKTAEIQARLAEQETKIQQDAALRQRELTENFHVEEQKELEDHEQRLREIRLKYQDDTRTAIANRDVLAALEARRTRDKEKREENEKFATAQRRRKEAYDRELRDLAEKTNRELQLARDAANKSIQIEQAKANAEIQLRQQNLDLMIQQYQAAYTYLQSLFNAAISGLSYTPPGDVLVPTSNYGVSNEDIFRMLHINGYANGGRFGANQDMVVGEKGWEVVKFDRPGRVLNQRQLAAESGKQTINNITVYTATNRREVKAISNSEARDVIFQVLED